jgi:hypothetical protein
MLAASTVLCVVLSLVSVGTSSASTHRWPKPSRAAGICANADACPVIYATAKPTTTDRELRRFLFELWITNFKGGPSGPYQLQRCGNPGTPPYHLHCVLFTSGTPQDLAALRSAFDSSQLFAEVNSSP